MTRRSAPLCGVAVLALVCVVALLAGSRWLSPWELVASLGHPRAQSSDLLLLSTFRLPRVAGAVLIGALLALSGGLLQSVTRNVLADPGLLGLHSGAHLALIGLLLFADPVTAGRLRVPVAFAGATAAAALVWMMSRRGRASSPDVMLIIGIAIGAALHAGGLMVAFAAPADLLARAVVWTTGNLSGVGGRDVYVLAAALVAVGAVAMALGTQLDVLALGDEAALALGVPVGRVRLAATGLAVLGAAVCVAVGGAIASLGLLAPNLARRLVGPRSRPLLLLSACCGAIFLVIADTLGRTAFGTFELPAGILIAAIGTPYFLWLLVTR